MLGIFKKKKSAEPEKPLKPIYKENKEHKTYMIFCPYCNEQLNEVYYLMVNSVTIGSCRFCGKELG